MKKNMKDKVLVILITVLLSVSITTFQPADVNAGYPVFVTNFMQLVQKYMQKLWDGVVVEMRSQWKQYVKDILKGKGIMDIREMTTKKLFKVASEYTSNPLFNTTQSIFGDKLKYKTNVKNFIKSYSPDFLDFRDARNNPERFNQKVASLSVLNAPRPLTKQDVKRMTVSQKMFNIRADVSHKLNTEQMTTASSGLSLAEEMAKKYDSSGSAVKKWDSMYSDAVIKDIAKMLYDNLQIQIAVLRVMATSKLADAVEIK